jgi:hypothetical protein
MVASRNILPIQCQPYHLVPSVASWQPKPRKAGRLGEEANEDAGRVCRKLKFCFLQTSKDTKTILNKLGSSFIIVKHLQPNIQSSNF